MGDASLLLDLNLRIARYREIRAIPRPTVAVATLIQTSMSSLVQEGKSYQYHKSKNKTNKISIQINKSYADTPSEEEEEEEKSPPFSPS